VTGVRYESSAGVATLTLDEADNRNALSATIIDGLIDGVQRGLAQEDVRVLLLTNEGSTFCAGGDLKRGGLTSRHQFSAVLSAIQDAGKPVLGRIAGHCMGGGVGLAAACDISIASKDVLLGFTEVRIGVAPAIVSVVCLPKLRPADARDLMLSGRCFSAEHAAHVGLINRAVPAAELDAAVAELCAEVIGGGPDALQHTKNLISRVPTLAREQAYAEMSELSVSLFASAEGAEGMSAFRERRPAAWVPQS
jgi:methylglutaconyl-CoA hydratase